MTRTLTAVCILSCLAMSAGTMAAAPAKSPQAPPQTNKAAGRTTVAVLDYQITMPGNTELGSQTAEVRAAVRPVPHTDVPSHPIRRRSQRIANCRLEFA